MRPNANWKARDPALGEAGLISLVTITTNIKKPLYGTINYCILIVGSEILCIILTTAPVEESMSLAPDARRGPMTLSLQLSASAVASLSLLGSGCACNKGIADYVQWGTATRKCSRAWRHLRPRHGHLVPVQANLIKLYGFWFPNCKSQTAEWCFSFALPHPAVLP